MALYTLMLHNNYISIELEKKKKQEQKILLKSQIGDFPGSPVVKTSPSNARGAGSIPGQGARIPYALGPENQNIKQKQYSNKFNKDFENGSH